MHACMHVHPISVTKTSDIIQKTKIGLLCDLRKIHIPKISAISQKTKIGMLGKWTWISIPMHAYQFGIIL